MGRRSILMVCALSGAAFIALASARSSGDPPAVAVTADARGDRPFEDVLQRSRELENNEPQNALQSAHEALQIAREHRKPEEILSALLQAAKTARGAAAYPEARELVAEGLALAAQVGNERMRGEFKVAGGMVDWNLGELPAALGSFLDAREIAEKLHRDDLRIGAEEGLGLVYGREENHAESLVHLQEAARLAEKTGDARLASTLNAIGNNYLLAKDYRTARGYFERSLALGKEGNNQRLIAYVTLNLGEIANRCGDQALAARYLDDALALCRRYDFRRGVADIHYLFARVERSLGQPDAAARHLDEGLAIATDLGNPDLLASYDEEYALTREAQGDYRGALAYARQLAEKIDSIRGERSREQMAELQARYEAEARNRTIKLLQRDAELQQSTLDLQKAELSRTLARCYAIVVLGVIIAAMIIARQRSRARRAARLLADVSAAKEVVEAFAAQKSRLLDIAARDLTESEALFRNAFAHSPLGLALVSLEGRWLRVNAALCQIVGRSESELLGTTFQAITHPDDLRSDLDLVGRLLRGEIETYHLDKRYVHQRGHVVWIRLDVSLHRDATTREPRYFVSQVQDITARHRADEQLLLAKEEAETASAAKNEFLSRMSHELRTPLNAILGFGQLLELEDLGGPQNQGVGYILTAGRHLLSLINEVLDLSSIESGNFALSAELTLVSDVLDTTLEMMRPLADEATVSVSLQRCPGPELVLADPRRLTQVLLNLLSNAIKYNRPGGEVLVACHVAGERLQISVRDTGRGIAGADLERIFAPFGRLSTTQEVPGTGLGLSLSKALTEAMGGTMSVTSEPGVGSTFTIDISRAEAPAEPALDPTRPPDRSTTRHSATGPRKVLYIEDDAINLELIQRLLMLDKSLVLRTATRGADGLALARSEPLDLILLDVHLPDMDGEEVLRELRRHPVSADVPVVVVSADAMGAQIDRMRQLGAEAYVTKPIEIVHLRQVIEETIQAAAGRRSKTDLHDFEHTEDEEIGGDDQVDVFRPHEHEYAGDEREDRLARPGEVQR